MKNIFSLIAIVWLSACLGTGLEAKTGPELDEVISTVSASDTIKPRFGDFVNDGEDNPFDLSDPSIVDQKVEYDPETGLYMITEKIGDEFYRAPSYMTFSEYLEWRAKQQEQIYFRQLAGVQSEYKSISGKVDPMDVIDVETDVADRLFGGNEISITPQGNIDLTFGYDYQKVENPVLTLRNQTNNNFDFDMNIQMSVNGQIGDKMNLGFDYNTQATFDFENQLKLAYDSEKFSEDDIIKNIEAGNVSLPLRTSLIQGNQSLFGIRTDFQFGRLRLTSVISQQNTEQNDIVVEGGSLINEFQVPIDEYDENRHFFLSQYNREGFEGSLDCLPFVNSLFNITRLEVWVTNDGRNSNSIRDVVTIADLGEFDRMTIEDPDRFTIGGQQVLDASGRVIPTNETNTIIREIERDPSIRSIDNAVRGLTSSPFDFKQSKDFEKVQARKLSANEYEFHPKLGFVSLNLQLRPDQVLGVAYEYTYNGRVFKVGEFADEEDGTQNDTLSVLFLKMLKSTTQRIDQPEWDLMMKNVYALGAFQLDREDFKLDIYYDDPGAGEKRFLPVEGIESVPLLTVFNLDNLNSQNDPRSDGVFDFVPGLTIYPRTGRMMFPVLEPFGSHLEDILQDIPPAEAEELIYNELYDSTLVLARETFLKNRFIIKGQYKSSGSSSEISLNTFNLPPGSVRVRAGGQVLRENIDYEVDYGIGRVRILNDAYLQPGTSIRVSFEDNTVFSLQRKTMLGVRADFDVNKNLVIGGTFLKLFERPFTQKVNLGDDPINNNIYGLDVNYSKEAPWLTRIVDGIPGISTTAPSSISVEAEGAWLKPGHSRAINVGDDRGGSVLIDDFEGAVSSIDLRVPANRWVLASAPRNEERNMESPWREAELINDNNYGVNRALLNWYRIERTIRNEEDRNNPYTMAIDQEEVFPNRSRIPGQFPDVQTLDLTYYPDRRGPYNFDVPDGTAYSEGIDEDGRLKSPETRWAGIMRRMDQNNFQRANFEFIEFWLLNPFIDVDGNGAVADSGKLYFNLGNISEDILRDSRMFFENGLPTPGSTSRTDETNWSRIPIVTNVIDAFSNVEEDRDAQDLGLDGLDDAAERLKYQEFVEAIDAGPLTPEARSAILQDVSNDNYRWFRNSAFTASNTVFERYENFNNTQGNSRSPSEGSNRVEAGTNLPDAEDIDDDNSLNESESYFEYEVPLVRTADNRLEQNEYITDVLDITGTNRTWYRFRIPIRQPTAEIGGIQDFRSIRFMRMFLKGFDQQTTLRFATLELVRSQWREFIADSECENDNVNTTADFGIDAVNIEENSERRPWSYVIPPGLQRERSIGQFNNVLQNEQSLALSVCDLPEGCSKGAYKQLGFDMRFYENLQMFIHAETEDLDVNDGDFEVFIRLGSDITRNYYEYSLPLHFSRGADPGDPQEVWRAENFMDFPLQQLTDTKIERDELGFPVEQAYRVSYDSDPANANELLHQITVRGRPNLAEVKSVYIAIRNPEDQIFVDDKCVQVWLNECRLNGLDERGGVAALARVNMELADLGNLTLAGSYSGFGFGALDQKINERSREKITEYDVSTNLELSKFIPGETRLRVPFYAQISNTTRNPQYDPYDKDILLKEKLSSEISEPEKDSIRDVAQDKTTIKSVNFTNVRVAPNPDRKINPLSISNFSATYAYSNTEHSDPLVENDQIKRYKGTLDYNYSNKPLYLEPFKKLSESDWLKPITEINFNPIPNRIGFSTTMDRRLGTTTHRFADPIYKTFFDNRFLWDRRYNLSWDLTKSLKFDFRANTNAIVDEPDGYANRNELELTSKQARRDSVITNLRDFGRVLNYNHTIDVSYSAPLKHFPALDWINLRGSYKATYNWNAGSLKIAEAQGNIIQNTQARQATVDFNFEKLYNKSKMLKELNRPPRRSSRNSPRNRSSRQNPRDQNQDNADTADSGERKKKGDKDKDGPGAKALLRPLMIVRSVKMNWSEQLGTTVPGFVPKTKFLGLSEGFSAPGWDFVAGLQPNLDPQSDNYWLDENGGKGGWITGDFFQNQEVIQNYAQNYDVRVSLEPFNDFRIDVNASSNFIQNTSLIYKNVDSTLQDTIFETRTPRQFGSYNISYFALHNLFKDSEADLEQLFDRFQELRKEISAKLPNEENAGTHGREGDEWTQGYGSKQREVLVPAFIAAYTGRSVDEVENRLFGSRPNILPRPNWTLSYDGLAKVGFFKNIFQRVSLSHGYNSDLQINQYQNNLDFNPSRPFVLDDDQDYYHQYRMENITISEAFNPLIGLDLTTLNDMTLNLNVARARSLDLSLGTDLFLRETRSSELSLGFGYLIKNVNIGFLTGSKKKRKNRQSRNQQQNQANNDPTGRGNVASPEGRDLNFTFDLAIRDDITVNHQIDQDIEAVPTRGLRSVRWSPAIDYQMNDNVNLRLFVDYSKTEPKTSLSFPITSVQGGLTVRLTLN